MDDGADKRPRDLIMSEWITAKEAESLAHDYLGRTVSRVSILRWMKKTNKCKKVGERFFVLREVFVRFLEYGNDAVQSETGSVAGDSGAGVSPGVPKGGFF